MNGPPRPLRRPATLLAIALTAVLGLVASGCRTAENLPDDAKQIAASAPRDGGSLVMAVDQETTGWQPQLSNWANAGYWVGSSIIEPLATFDENGETVPWLAESITPTVTGQFDSWTIKVKPNITFHNNEKLDASVLLKNFELITNGRALIGTLLGSRFKGFTPIDDLTIRVDLTVPWADFPAQLAGPTGMVTAKEMLDAPIGGLAHPIGTGPFVFQSWTIGESFKATKNPNYWRQGEPHLDSIEFRPFVDNKQALSALQNGDIDMMVTTKAADVGLAGTDLVVHTDYKTEKTFVQLMTIQNPDRAKNPLTDLRVRRALAYGTDREAIRNQVGAGQALGTSTQPMVEGTPWAIPEDETGYYPYDLTKAKAEVAAYTAETGSSTIEFELTTSLAPDDLGIANSLVDQWKAIGINARVHGKETQTNTVDSIFGNFDAVTQRNYAYPNPDTDLFFFLTENARGPGALSVNFAQLKEPVIDAAGAHLQSTIDRSVQREDWRTITRKINEQAVNLWLYDTPYAVIHAPSVHGLESLDTHAFASSTPRPWLWGDVWRS